MLRRHPSAVCVLLRGDFLTDRRLADALTAVFTEAPRADLRFVVLFFAVRAVFLTVFLLEEATLRFVVRLFVVLLAAGRFAVFLLGAARLVAAFLRRLVAIRFPPSWPFKKIAYWIYRHRFRETLVKK